MTRLIKKTQSLTFKAGISVLDFVVKKVSSGTSMAPRYW
jgi:hypothetical protein